MAAGLCELIFNIAGDQNVVTICFIVNANSNQISSNYSSYLQSDELKISYYV